MEAPFPFESRRSAVVSTNGVVASSQPLASDVGSRILRLGGNAADAAVAVAAVLNLTEPCSTGIGGDCFCLYFDAATGKVSGLNGSGRAPQQATLERILQDFPDGNVPYEHGHTVTVPGAAAGWVDTIERFGRLSLADVLAPAIEMGRSGYPIHEVAAYHWQKGAHLLTAADNPHGTSLLLPNGRAPCAGDVMTNVDLANTFEELATKGKAGFYQGRIAQAIVNAARSRGSTLSIEDLQNHTSTFDDPIHVDYEGVQVWEIPPNGQGITALIALNILKHVETLPSLKHNSAAYLHVLIEAMRLAFADARYYVADPAITRVPIQQLLSDEYAKERSRLIHAERAQADVEKGRPFSSSDTVYFTVVDGEGNACSFINSNYMGFGTGLVPEGCGFTLQNRGANFSFTAGHPNVIEPKKRPYHTIIPGMATKDGQLYASFGVMGGFMQPQGHVQVLLNMIQFGMNPQEALDVPRFCIGSGHTGVDGGVAIEEGIPEDVIVKLRSMGHTIRVVTGRDRALFGRGQIIKQEERNDRKVFIGGSDPRADGCAIALS